MSEAVFLDTGVLFGYSVPLDRHHFSCDEFIDENDVLFYTCPTASDEFENLKRTRITDFSTAVLDHIRKLKRHDLDRSLGPTDLKDIKTDILSRSNDAYQYLYRYYDNALEEEYFEINPPASFADREQIFQDLRTIQREAEAIASARSDEIEDLVQIWDCQDTHESVRSSLSMIDQNDRIICIAAHDLACNGEPTVIFTTTNPRDFIDNNRENVILETTAIAEIEDLSV